MKTITRNHIFTLRVFVYILAYIVFNSLNCTNWEKTHEVEWTCAFFLPDGNVGAIAFEYDFDYPSGAWQSAEKSNNDQKLYSYNVETEELELLGILMDNAPYSAHYPQACRSGNFVLFKTNYNGNGGSSIGLFDLETRRVLGYADIQPKGAIFLEGLSENGKIAMFSYGSGFGKLYDFGRKKIIWENDKLSPFYFTNDSTFYFVTSPQDTCGWRLMRATHYKDTAYDTIGCFKHAYIGRTTNDHNFYQGVKLEDFTDLYSDVLTIIGDLDKILNGSYEYKSYRLPKFDVDEDDYHHESGNYVFVTYGSVFLGSVNDTSDQGIQKILNRSSTRR